MAKTYADKLVLAQGALDAFVKECRADNMFYGDSYALGYISSATSRIASQYLTKAQFAEFLKTWEQATQSMQQRFDSTKETT